LLSENYDVGLFDIIFLRNVLIYFKTEDIEKIVNQMMQHLQPNGVLFLGHSESLSDKKTPFHVVGNSIYKAHQQSHIRKFIPSAEKRLMKVFIVDDSLTVRTVLRKILSVNEGFEVIGDAENPIIAEQKLRTLSPDVMTLDIHMPEMDGITYLESLKDKPHCPILMISSISYEDAVRGLHCFELGAVDYIEKPMGLNLELESERIRSAVRGAFLSQKRHFKIKHINEQNVQYKSSEVVSDLIALGASTGGVEALKNVLIQFPENSAPVLIAQHIPAHFSAALARRLDELCKIRVLEAQNGDIVQMGHAYIAPGGKHMRVVLHKDTLHIEIDEGEPGALHKPSIDSLFQSIVPVAARYHIAAALLTGMGSDGAVGMKALKDAGAHTIAQNEETCVVFGMPCEAIKLEACIEILPLMSIPYHLFSSFKKSRAA
jgi:two-component system chemotaxis response regulator CheB